MHTLDKIKICKSTIDHCKQSIQNGWLHRETPNTATESVWGERTANEMIKQQRQERLKTSNALWQRDIDIFLEELKSLTG